MSLTTPTPSPNWTKRHWWGTFPKCEAKLLPYHLLVGPLFWYASTLTLEATQKGLHSVEETICWCKVPSNYRAGVTQAPWLHQFRLRWTRVHPSYWTSRSEKGRVKFSFSSPSNHQFVFAWYYPSSTIYPIHPPTPLILQCQNLYLFSTTLIIIGKTYIFSWLNFSNYTIFK
jgi:hypothetical protein